MIPPAKVDPVQQYGPVLRRHSVKSPQTGVPYDTLIRPPAVVTEDFSEMLDELMTSMPPTDIIDMQLSGSQIDQPTPESTSPRGDAPKRAASKEAVDMPDSSRVRTNSFDETLLCELVQNAPNQQSRSAAECLFVSFLQKKKNCHLLEMIHLCSWKLTKPKVPNGRRCSVKELFRFTLEQKPCRSKRKDLVRSLSQSDFGTTVAISHSSNHCFQPMDVVSWRHRRCVLRSWSVRSQIHATVCHHAQRWYSRSQF